MKKCILYVLTAVLLLGLTACGGEAQSTTPPATQPTTSAAPVPPDMQSLYQTLSAQMPEMIPLDADMLLNFCGIQAEDCTQVCAAICADGLRTDEIWLIEAADEAALERITALAENRLQIKGEESITYSPEQYAVVEKAQIITDGLYFALIVSPDADDLAELFRGAIG